MIKLIKKLRETGLAENKENVKQESAEQQARREAEQACPQEQSIGY